MRRRARWEPAVLLVAGLVVSGYSWWLPAVERARFAAPEAPATVLHPEVLVSPRESREVEASDWLRLSDERPAAFRASAGFCHVHQERPLPNCRNLLVAGRARVATAVAGGPDAF